MGVIENTCTLASALEIHTPNEVATVHSASKPINHVVVYTAIPTKGRGYLCHTHLSASRATVVVANPRVTGSWIGLLFALLHHVYYMVGFSFLFLYHQFYF